ncbi:MAG: ATP phosphoribosyltransferase [Clostridiaceae bacterium]
MKPIRIALTKGRLLKDAEKIFEGIGYNPSCFHNIGRKLILEDKENGVEYILAKAFDVLTYVDSGACDMGIVGKDVLMELDKEFYEVLDLNIGKCIFALAAPNNFKMDNGYRRIKIASKYPNVAKAYFHKKGQDVEVIKINGSVELAPILGVSDAIVDIVETGDTLRENGLNVVDKICDISARLIVNKASMKINREKIDEIIGKIEKLNY